MPRTLCPKATPIPLDADVVVQNYASCREPHELAVEAMRHWRGDPGKARLRALLFPAMGKHPGDLIALLEGNGLHEIVSPLAWTLQTLARRSRVKFSRRTVIVPVKRVLSHMWQPIRVARNFKQRAAGTKPPPVSLSRIWFRGEDFYIVDDGHHRCEVARMVGEDEIRARIIETRHFVPSDWVITVSGFKLVRTGARRKAEHDLRAAARWLGVKRETRD